MSILDFTEDSRYQFVGVALASDDAAIILNVKEANAPAVLMMAIEMLKAELVKCGGVIPDNLPTKQESRNVSTHLASAS